MTRRKSEQSLKGNHGQIKETTLAVELFGRSPGYDPKTDPIVRVHAKRLRDRLDSYYAAEGARDPIRIYLPKGSYIPCTVLHPVGFTVDRVDISDRFSVNHVKGQLAVAATPRVSFLKMNWMIWVMALDWSPDGRSLLVAEKPSQTAPVRLVIVDLATGNRRPLTDPPTGSSGDLEGKFSPDGKTVAFHRGGLGDIYVVPSSGENNSAPRRLTADNPGVLGIAWSRNGRYILFGSMEGVHGWGIWRVSVDGGVSSPVMTGSMDLISPAVSPDGRHLAVEQRDQVTNLSAIPLASLGSSQPFASSSRQDFEPAYSPDGKQVAFASTRSGSIELWLANSDGGSPRQLTYLRVPQDSL